jgi:hypothetical protein
MEDLPPVHIKGTVTVGAAIKQRLEEAARVEGADASYLARRILREHLDQQPTVRRALPLRGARNEEDCQEDTDRSTNQHSDRFS